MKTIAITQRLVENDSYRETRDALDVRWAVLMKRLGYMPIILPTDYGFREYFRRFRIDGVILTGGNDLAVFSGSVLSARRDAFEKRLIRHAVKNRIPVLGVCRGLLVIADYFKSKVIRVEGHVGVSHGLEVSGESAYRDALRKVSAVNSYHNYAVEKVSGGLAVSARGSDGVIEAIEHKRYPVFAQMWHTERTEPFSTAEMKVMKKVLAGC